MKLLLDEHLSRKLIPMLEPTFPGSIHVSEHGLERADDETLWRYARDGGFIVTSKDDDFQVMSFARGHPPKVIWLRSGNGPTKEVFEILVRASSIIESFVADQRRSMLVLP